ncbi:MAG: PIN domain-containing protein [Pyrinomonadaceae bacterium MAG19_C2-C3]|nr:PIN domain-containing protein [Pyrinomonadaceae bacterium MAG19_C2-C3]
MAATIKPPAVVTDANILIAICTKEQKTYQIALTAFNDYAQRGFSFFAPNVLVAEVLFVLCQKAAQGVLRSTEHRQAVKEFTDYFKVINPPPNGEAALVTRAEDIRTSYGCSRTSDGLYLALTENLSTGWSSEIVTFDDGFRNQAAKNAPSVKVNVLPI